MPYISTPIVFVLISFVVVVPMLFGIMHFAINAVHIAQQSLTIGYNDVEIGDDGDNELDVCEYVGTLSCGEAGLNTDVYYGINRVSLRNGAGMSKKSVLGESVKLSGYSSGAFRALYNLREGDVISFSVNDDKRLYQITDIVLSKNADVNGDLILCTTKDNSAFSYYDDDMLYVIAKEVR